jgi:4-carboxymuconolactone decarboxylase
MSEKWDRGAAKFEEVIGFVPPEEGPAFLKLTVENLFADVWAREGLSVRDRRLVTITVLAMMMKEESLAGHLKQALKGDLTKRELEEVMIHLAHYAGWPVGQLGFDTLMKTLAAIKSERTAEKTPNP